MNQTILPASLLTAALKTQYGKAATTKTQLAKPCKQESFLHQLFFGLQTPAVAIHEEQQLQWNEPDAFSSYE